MSIRVNSFDPIKYYLLFQINIHPLSQIFSTSIYYFMRLRFWQQMYLWFQIFFILCPIVLSSKSEKTGFANKVPVCTLVFKVQDENPQKPNFVVIVTDAFDGRIVANKTYEKVVNLANISKLQGEFLKTFIQKFRICKQNQKKKLTIKIVESRILGHIATIRCAAQVVLPYFLDEKIMPLKPGIIIQVWTPRDFEIGRLISRKMDIMLNSMGKWTIFQGHIPSQNASKLGYETSISRFKRNQR